jgi:hypothetical protein
LILNINHNINNTAREFQKNELNVINTSNISASANNNEQSNNNTVNQYIGINSISDGSVNKKEDRSDLWG